MKQTPYYLRTEVWGTSQDLPDTIFHIPDISWSLMSNTTCSRAGLWFWKARIKPKLPGRAQILLCQPSMPLMKQIWSHADTFMWSEGNPESTERWIETLMVFGLFMGFVGIKKTTDCQQTFIWKDAEKEEEEQGMKIIRSVFSLDVSPRMKRKEWKVRKDFFLSSDATKRKEWGRRTGTRFRNLEFEHLFIPGLIHVQGSVVLFLTSDVQ